MKIEILFSSFLLVLFLFLLNTLIILGFLKLNPSFLINNHSYQPQHEQILNYLLSGDDKNLKVALPQGEFSHIKDVRTLIAKIPLTLFLIIAVSSYLAKKYQNISIIEVLKYSILILLLLSLVGAFFFMPLFTVFHQIFFPQGNWAFLADSILIQLYPESFWIKSVTGTSTIALLELITVFIISMKRTLTRD
jgi:hypothetical protein